MPMLAMIFIFVSSLSEAAASIPTTCQVAIAGGGLGGLAACTALRQRGIDAQVFEAAPALLRGSTGTGIMISANGFSALESIDASLPDKMREIGARIVRQTIHVCRQDGKQLKELSLDSTVNFDRFGADQYNVAWARAHEVLAATVPEEYVHCDCKLESFTVSGETVDIEFAGGHSVRASLLVGADGAGSAVRRMVAGEAACLTKYNGQLLWNAILPTARVRAHADGEVEYYTCGADGQVILAFDAGEGQTSWYLTILEEHAPPATKALLAEAAAEGTVFGGFGRHGVKDELKQAFAAWPVAVELLEATPEAQIFERRLCDRKKLMRWQDKSKRVVLMGDAAHPMVPSQGQGTMVTWEDAAELAECLVARAGAGPKGPTSLDVPAAVDTFVARRAKRCAMVQKFSRQAYMGRPSPTFYPLKMVSLTRSFRKISKIFGYKS